MNKYEQIVRRPDVQDFLRIMIAGKLHKCSQSQRDFFERLYPGGVNKMPVKDLGNALDLVERTVAKNERTGRLNKGES